VTNLVKRNNFVGRIISARRKEYQSLKQKGTVALLGSATPQFVDL